MLKDVLPEISVNFTLDPNFLDNKGSWRIFEDFIVQ